MALPRWLKTHFMFGIQGLRMSTEFGVYLRKVIITNFFIRV